MSPSSHASGPDANAWLPAWQFSLAHLKQASEELRQGLQEQRHALKLIAGDLYPVQLCILFTSHGIDLSVRGQVTTSRSASWAAQPPRQCSKDRRRPASSARVSANVRCNGKVCRLYLRKLVGCFVPTFQTLVAREMPTLLCHSRCCISGAVCGIVTEGEVSSVAQAMLPASTRTWQQVLPMPARFDRHMLQCHVVLAAYCAHAGSCWECRDEPMSSLSSLPAFVVRLFGFVSILAVQ